MTMCPSCDEAVLPGNTFCAACGHPLSLDEAVTQDFVAGTLDEDGEDRHSDSSSDHGRFLPGRELAGRYRIVSLVGRGGMGEVDRADDLRLGQTVALKFLPTAADTDPQHLELLRSDVFFTP